MEKTKKILFPTDFSEPAASAFRYALLFADQLQATIEVIHVVYPQGESLDFPGMSAAMTQTVVEGDLILIKKFIDTGVTQMLRQLKNAPLIATTVVVGTPIGQIKEIAKRDNIDLIIMGSRGTSRSRFDRMMGSIASGVVEKAPCPVMVVPEETSFKRFEKIAYASNVLNSDPYELWKALSLLEKQAAEIHLVHFNYKKQGDLNAYSELEKMSDFLEKQNADATIYVHNLPGKSLETDLNRFIEKEEIDILMMYQEEHSIWERLFIKSATKAMSIRTKVPLLVLKE